MTLPGDLLHRLIDTLKDLTFVPQRSSEGKMVFNVDHCFGIKGQGTIMTGTVLQGSLKVGDSVEISALKESRKVKSMQMFKKPVQSAKQGDRIGRQPTLWSVGLFWTIFHQLQANTLSLGYKDWN